MAFKRLSFLMIFLIASLVACTRQASEPVQVISEASTGELPTLPTQTPTNPSGIAVITNTPFVAPSETPVLDEPTATESVKPTETDATILTETLDTGMGAETATAPPTNTLAPSATSTPDVTATDMPEIVMFTATPFVSPTSQSAMSPVEAVTSTPVVVATQPVLTPLLPSGNQSAISTPTPRATTELQPTPTDAFFTPESAVTEDIPDECIYIVKAGDTVYRIAVNNDTTVNAIASVNPGLNPNLIRPGDEIIIPDCEADDATPIPTFSGDGSSSTGTVPLGGLDDQGTSGGVENIHVVQAGETLGIIARRYGVTLNAIVEANNIANPNRLSIGQRLVIPPAEN